MTKPQNDACNCSTNQEILQSPNSISSCCRGVKYNSGNDQEKFILAKCIERSWLESASTIALRIVQHEFLSEAIFKWVSKGLHLFCFSTLGNWSRKFSPYDNKSYAKLTLITNKSPVFIVCLFLLRVLIRRYFPVFWLAYMITMVFVIRHSVVHSGTVSCTSCVFLIETVISFIPWCKRVFDCGQTRPQRSMKVYPPIMENTWPK